MKTKAVEFYLNKKKKELEVIERHLGQLGVQVDLPKEIEEEQK